MSIKTLLNIEAAFGMTDSDISALRSQIDAGERLIDDKLNKNYDLIKLPPLEENDAIKQLIGEIKETIAEDFGFVLELTEKNDQEYSVFGRKILPQQSDLLSPVGGADMVVVVALNGVGEGAPRLVMDFGPFVPNSLGELRTNDYLAFPSWVPYGWTRNHSEDSLYTLEMFFNIIGTKTDETTIASFVPQERPEPIVETALDAVTKEAEVVSDED